MNQRSEQEIMKNWKTHDKPLVSISCITYNHENFITEALDSFLMQETDFPFEVLVHDDCSTDNTANIIREYEKKYPNIIKPIYQKENQYSKGIKVGATFNFPRAKGEYIALCEGDDYWTDPEKLQIQLDLMLENPECYLSFHPADEVTEGKLSGRVFADHDSKNRVFTDIEMIRGIDNVFCPTASMVFYRGVMSPIPEFFATAPVGDNFMQFLGSLHGGALFIAKKMSIYRTGHPGAWSTIMEEKDNISVASYIRNREDLAFKYTKSLNDMGRFIDQKYREEIDRKISEKLLFLSLLYLKNDRYQDFQKMIVRSQKIHKSTFISYRTLYHFRFVPFILKTMIKFRKVFVTKA